ncbi:Interleukin-2 receptor subunit alpha, partial [Galemys pyrenaicus]
SCDIEPPILRNATFKVSAYKIGTGLNCQCKTGFRRRGSTLIHCVGNLSHPYWGDKCQCKSISKNTGKKVTTNPEEQKERKTTESQSQTQLTDQVNIPGHCGEPPPWEHEYSERIYHFVVGQTVDYHCAQGFRALQRVVAKSVCIKTCGRTMWTKPKLTCISERETSLTPGRLLPSCIHYCLTTIPDRVGGSSSVQAVSLSSPPSRYPSHSTAPHHHTGVPETLSFIHLVCQLRCIHLRMPTLDCLQHRRCPSSQWWEGGKT